jgi:hypothetical protein
MVDTRRFSWLKEVEQAKMAERERCAKIADEAQAKVRKVGVAGPYVASEIAAAIRNQNK